MEEWPEIGQARSEFGAVRVISMRVSRTGDATTRIMLREYVAICSKQQYTK